MIDWEPATEAEVALRDALRVNDQELYFRLLARLDLLLPVAQDPAGETGWGTWTTSGRTHLLAFTSLAALRACLGDSAVPTRRQAYRDLAVNWPNLEWWLAVNPGLPIEGYLPAWFVSQLARGDVRLPGRTMGARSRLERLEQVESINRARATAAVPKRTGLAASGGVDGRTVLGGGFRQRLEAAGLTSARPGPQASEQPSVPAARPESPSPAASSPAASPSPAASLPPAASSQNVPLPLPAGPIRAAPVSAEGQGGPPGYGGRLADSIDARSARTDASPPPAYPGTALPRRDIPPPSNTFARPTTEDGGLTADRSPAATDGGFTVADRFTAGDTGFTGSNGGLAAMRSDTAAGARRPAASEDAARTPAADEAASTTYDAEPVAPPFFDDASARRGGGTPESNGTGAAVVGFEPANSVEADLLAAAEQGSTDRFLSTLLLATVLLPPATSTAGDARPGDDGFVWRTETLDGDTYVVAFTSPEILRASLPQSSPGSAVTVKFARLISHWPDNDWSFAVNPGTPVGARLPGEQIVALANWAAEVGLGVDGPEPDASANPPADQHDERPRSSYAPVAPDPHRPIEMQKAIAPSQVAYYLDRGYDRVSGFVQRATELAHLTKPATLYAALGLNHPGSPFAADADEIYLLRWPAHRPSLYRIPYGGQTEPAMRAMEGWVIERPPFRGNGFAPGEGSDVVAEFKVDSVRLPHGARLYRVDAGGGEKLVAVLDCDGPVWRRVEEG